MTTPLVFPVFSSPISALQIDEDLSDLKILAKKEKFVGSDNEEYGSYKCYVSDTNTFLNDFPREKSIIEGYFDFFKNEIMKFGNTQFQMTTSWVTKTVKGSQSQYHRHKNCLYSGVLYLDTIEDGAPIIFDNENLNPSSFLLIPTEWNIYNSSTWVIQPKENLVVFFPSYLRHKIGIHKSKTPRYSIAFNFHPVGNLGYNDSSANISLGNL